MHQRQDGELGPPMARWRQVFRIRQCQWLPPMLENWWLSWWLFFPSEKISQILQCRFSNRQYLNCNIHYAAWGAKCSSDGYGRKDLGTLLLHNSRFWDPWSQGVDALAQQNWKEHNKFVNCLFNLLPKVLNKIWQSKAIATVIAPWWPGKPFSWHHQGYFVYRHRYGWSCRSGVQRKMLQTDRCDICHCSWIRSWNSHAHWSVEDAISIFLALCALTSTIWLYI